MRRPDKPAPTGERVPTQQRGRALARLALAFAFAFDLAFDFLAPSRGRVEVLRSGPTEQDRSEGMPSISEAPNARGKSPWLLGAGRRSVFPSDSL
ncbi:hypothetical protein EMIT0P218_30307 [Pseudomonas sp. IT-P218]